MFRSMNAIDVLCPQLTRDLFAIATFLLILLTRSRGSLSVGFLCLRNSRRDANVARRSQVGA